MTEETPQQSRAEYEKPDADDTLWVKYDSRVYDSDTVSEAAESLGEELDTDVIAIPHSVQFSSTEEAVAVLRDAINELK